MEVLLSSPRGFCAGVVRAIDVVDICLRKYGPPVYVKHQIVHNPYVVNDLERRGAITVEDVDEIPAGSLVVFSAHGSPPEDFVKAKAKKYHREGKKVVLVGHQGHQEVRGTMGQVEMTLIDGDSEEELSAWADDQEVAVLTQTTLSVGDTEQAINSIRDKFPNAVVRNDICYATTNRQDAVRQMAGSVDMVLVIGAQNSSNCNRLREVAESLGVPSYLINGPEEIEPSWLEGRDTVGITSGASTPEVLVESVIEKLAPDKVTIVSGVEEDISFSLPKQLR